MKKNFLKIALAISAAVGYILLRIRKNNIEEEDMHLSHDTPTHEDEIYGVRVLFTNGNRIIVVNLFHAQTMNLIQCACNGFIGEMRVWEKMLLFSITPEFDGDKFAVPMKFIEEHISDLWDSYDILALEF